MRYLWVIRLAGYIQKFKMEKSMVQELSSLTYSNIFNNRVSFISTHISDPDINQLRRSRIQNLPCHRKEDLSSKINFVVVFQTIEIERLSREIESLRVRAKDWQRQRSNYQNYEVQIRQLTERCHMLELQKEGVEESQEKMKIFCEKLYRQFQEYKAKYGEGQSGLKEKYNLEKKRSEQLQAEIDKWRNRYTSLERSKTKELEEMRLQVEAQRKSMINREIKEITIKYENEVQNLVAELRKAREECEWRSSEMQRLQHLLDGFDMRQDQIKEIEDKMYQYENRFVMLSQENYRINELLRWKSEELERLKTNDKELRNKLQTSRTLEDTNRSLSTQISRLTKELQQSKVASSRSSEQLERLQLQSSKLVEYEKLVEKSGAEIERLNGIIHSKIKELDQYKGSINILQTKLNAVNNATQKEFANYEERMVSESREKERLNAQLKNRLAENQNLKVKIGELEKGFGRIQFLERENQELKGQVNSSGKRMDEFRAKISLLEENVIIMEELQNTLKNDQKMKQELVSERERLNATIRSLTLQLQTSTEKLSALQGEQNKYSSIQVELKEYHSRYAYMTQQLDRINAEIQLRVGELQQLKESMKTLSNSKNIYQNIEQKLVDNLAQMEGLILVLDQSRRENERLQNTNMTLESSQKNLQGDLLALNNEREKLNQILSQKSGEITRLSQQVESMAVTVSEHRQLQLQNQELTKASNSFKANYQQLEVRYKNQCKKSQQYSSEVQRLCSELIELRQQPKMSAKLAEEIALIRRQCEQKSNTIAFLIKRIQVIENILKNLKQRSIMQCQLSDEMRRKIQSFSNKMGFFDQVIDMANRYSEELEKVNETNMMLESHNRLLDLEMCESMKVVDIEEQVNSRPQQNLANTFGQPVAYKNESIAARVPPVMEARDGNSFTFKQMEYNRSGRTSQPNRRIASEETRTYQTIERREEPQIYSLHQARESTSMTSSFINSLASKEPVMNRFQNVQRVYHQGHQGQQGYQVQGYQGQQGYQIHQVQQNLPQNPSFGRSQAEGRVHYVSDHSPSARPATSSFYSPTNRQVEVRYVAIDSQLEPQGHQVYTNPFHETNPQNNSAIFDNANIKRVTSYTQFMNYPGSTIQGNAGPRVPMQMNPQISQQVSMGNRELPNIRILEAAQSQNIVNSPKSNSNYGKPVRLGSSDSANMESKYKHQ